MSECSRCFRVFCFCRRSTTLQEGKLVLAGSFEVFRDSGVDFATFLEEEQYGEEGDQEDEG